MFMIDRFKYSLFFKYFICFFVFSGFYAILGFVISFFGYDFTRWYSVPVRVISSLFMVVLIVKKIKIKLNILFYFILFFLLYILATYLVDYYGQLEESDLKIDYIMYLIIYCIVPFLFFSYMDYSEIRDLLIKTTILSGLALNISSIFLYKDLLVSGIARISFLQYESDQGFLSPLALSYASSLTIVICFCQIINLRERKELLVLLPTLILSFVPFSLGASRGSLLTLFFSILFYFILVKNVKSKVKIISILPFSLIGMIIFSNKMGSAIFDRFLGIGQSYEANDTSVTLRLGQWNQAFEYIEMSPILGGHFLTEGVYPHNSVLEIFMGQGFVLFCLFLFFIFYFFYNISKFTIKYNDYLILVFFVHGLIMSLFSGSINTAILLFISFGLYFSATRDLKSRNV